MRIQQHARPPARTEVSGIELRVVEPRVEGAVGALSLNHRRGAEAPRHQVDRAAVGRRADRGRRSRAAVEVRVADELRREERPRVVRRRVGVVERNAVERDVVVAVLEAAVERLAVAEADAVRREAVRARRHLHHLGVVGDRRRVVADELAADLGLRRTAHQVALRGRGLRRGRKGRGHRHLFRERRDAQRDRDRFRLAGRERHGGAAHDREVGGRHFDRVGARHEPINREVTGGVRHGGVRIAARVVSHDHGGVGDGAAVGIENGAGDRSNRGTRLGLRVHRRSHADGAEADDCGENNSPGLHHITHATPLRYAIRFTDDAILTGWRWQSRDGDVNST